MGNHCLPCHLAAQRGQRKPACQRLKDEPARRSDPPLPRPLPVTGREQGAARWTVREPKLGWASFPAVCRHNGRGVSPGEGRWSPCPSLTSCPAHRHAAQPGILWNQKRERGFQRFFPKGMCPVLNPHPRRWSVDGTQRRRLRAAAGRNGTEMSGQAQVPAQAGLRGGLHIQGHLRLGGWPSAQRLRTQIYLPAHPNSPKDDQIMRLKQASSPGHGDKPKC